MKIESYNPLISLVEKKIKEVITSIFNIQVDSLMISLPPSSQNGHICVNLYALAKQLKKSPEEVAQKISLSLEYKHEVVKAYINIWLEAKDFFTLSSSISSGDYFLKNKASCAKTMLEYSQPNTHKDLHVGHMRNLALGSCLANLYTYFSLPITTATFPGDVGSHVAKCLWYIKAHKQTIPEENAAKWLGDMYVKASCLLEDLKSKRESNGIPTDKELKILNEMTLILDQVRNESGEYYSLWKETREISLALMKSTYEWAGVSFDKWYYESEVDQESVDYIKSLYEQGKIIKDDGALGLPYKDGFCVLLKKDGNGLYSTKDVLLAKKKFEEGIEESLYLVDERQKNHFNQVFYVLDKIGFEQSKNCKHLSYAHVELPSGAMKSRDGNVVALSSLIGLMEEKIQKEFKLSKENAIKIAKGAIFYGMLKSDPNKKIVFDLDKWLEMEGNTGTYLQYAAVRAKSLLSKVEPVENYTYTLSGEKEFELISKLSMFNHGVQESLLKYKPSILCTYLYELCKIFNGFYVSCPISKENDMDVKGSRLELVKNYSKVLEKGLSLLGIEIPSEM